MNSYIERNKKIMGGVPVIKGTRVPVSTIIHYVARGRSIEDIVALNFPDLKTSIIKQALTELASQLK